MSKGRTSVLTRVVEGVVALVAITVGGLLAGARVWDRPGTGFYWKVAEVAHMAGDLGPTDFAHVQRRPYGNDALVCPEVLCPGLKAKVVPKVYPLPAKDLIERVRRISVSEPGSGEMTCGTCDVSARFVEYSSILRFPDVIDVRAVPVGDKAATIALYSRSVVGYGDLGINEARLKRWLAALDRIVPSR